MKNNNQTFKSKNQMLWEVSKEAQDEFISNLPENIRDIETFDLFKMIRGADNMR